MVTLLTNYGETQLILFYSRKLRNIQCLFVIILYSALVVLSLDTVPDSGRKCLETLLSVRQPGATLTGGEPKVRILTSAATTRGHEVNPADSLADVRVHSRRVPATSDTPGHDTRLTIRVGLLVRCTHERSASVSFTRVGVHRGNLDLLENHLELSCSSKLVFAPARGK